MKLSIKNLFIFGAVYSSLYLFLLGLINIKNSIIDNANFNFLNLSADLSAIESFYGGASSYIYNVGGYGINFTLNFTFILYLISYISLPFYFVIQFFYNITELIIYEISVLQYPISILPFGIGAMLSGLFYLILIIVIITGIKIVSSGFGE